MRSLLGLDTGAGATGAAPSAAPAGASAGASQNGQVCKVVSHKEWGSAANAQTGITVTRLSGGSFAVGVAMGHRPEVVAFDRAGQGRVVQPAIASAIPLAHAVSAAQGRRDLQRVTPALGTGNTLVAYADYRDIYKNKRRRVACGRTDSTHKLLLFDGKPLLVQHEDSTTPPPMGRVAHAGVIPEDSAAPAKKPPPSATASTATRGRPKLPGKLRRFHVVRPKAKKAPPAKRPEKPQSELRDCRSFVDPPGHDAWAVGSELHAEPRSDGSTEYSMRFFVEPAPGQGHVVLHTVKLPKSPDNLYTFDAPVAEKLPDGSYVLAARYRGSLYAWTLGHDKRPRGPARVYGGGYPTMPHMLRDGDNLLVLFSQKTTGDHWAARLARLSGRGGTLPAALDPLSIDSDPSQAGPTFAIAGGKRWIAYQAGDRRHGQLVLVPVDDKLAVVGRPFRVTKSDQSVYESHLFGLDTGKLLVVYIESSPSARLVSEVLDCRVEG